MYPHLVLLASVFVHKARAIDRVLMNFRRKRYRPYDFGSVANRGIHDLLDRIIDDLRIVCSNFDAKACFQFFLLFRYQGTCEKVMA